MFIIYYIHLKYNSVDIYTNERILDDVSVYSNILSSEWIYQGII